MTTTLQIKGMSCQHCVMSVKKEIQKLDIKNLEVKIGEATIEFDESITKMDNIIDAVIEAGFEVVA